MISIHAVLWDRDLTRERVESVTDISIHAVLWDRDLPVQFCKLDFDNFNPRGPLGPRPDIMSG